MGRPLKEIDGEQVRLMAATGSRAVEIAAYFMCSVSTVTHRFSEEYKLGKSQAKRALRSRQFERAMEGSDKMLIHLGKNMLGQTDRVDVTSKGKSVGSFIERAHNPMDLHAERNGSGANGKPVAETVAPD